MRHHRNSTLLNGSTQQTGLLLQSRYSQQTTPARTGPRAVTPLPGGQGLVTHIKYLWALPLTFKHGHAPEILLYFQKE